MPTASIEQFNVHKMPSLSLIIEKLLLPCLSLMVAVGLAWLFSPAITAGLSDELQHTTIMSNDDPQKKKNPPLLSLVVPAYDEERRIPAMMKEANDFLTSAKGQNVLEALQRFAAAGDASNNTSREVEWVIVNDGSKDQTSKVVVSVLKDLKATTWRVISLQRNSGKGAAVQTGMMHAQGIFRLMVDADGATEFGPGLERIVKELAGKQKQPLLAVFGSRAHLQQQATQQRSLIRSLLMYAFHFFVSLFVSSRIKDTQCGFKLFTKSSAELVFRTLHLHRWAFDIEIVLIAEMVGIEIVEVDVPWHEVDGSKLNTSKLALAIVSLTMLRDMICVRACYMTRIWKVRRS